MAALVKCDCDECVEKREKDHWTEGFIIGLVSGAIVSNIIWTMVLAWTS